MTALDALHTFAVTKQPDGTAMIEAFRRVDMHELTIVSRMLHFDKTADFAAIGERFCQSLDLELASRPRVAAE